MLFKRILIINIINLAIFDLNNYLYVYYSNNFKRFWNLKKKIVFFSKKYKNFKFVCKNGFLLYIILKKLLNYFNYSQYFDPTPYDFFCSNFEKIK